MCSGKDTFVYFGTDGEIALRVFCVVGKVKIDKLLTITPVDGLFLRSILKVHFI